MLSHKSGKLGYWCELSVSVCVMASYLVGEGLRGAGKGGVAGGGGRAHVGPAGFARAQARAEGIVADGRVSAADVAVGTTAPWLVAGLDAKVSLRRRGCVSF